MKREIIGGAWEKGFKNKDGRYYSITLNLPGNKVNLVMFPNKYKNKDNQPDYVILISNKRKKANDQDKEHEIP